MANWLSLSSELGLKTRQVGRDELEKHLGGAPLPGALVWDAYIDASGRVYVVDVAVRP